MNQLRDEHLRLLQRFDNPDLVLPRLWQEKWQETSIAIDFAADCQFTAHTIFLESSLYADLMGGWQGSTMKKDDDYFLIGR